jgi:MFS family permease
VSSVVTATRQQVWAAAFASIMAWSFDLFDLFLILFVAPTIGALFFPSRSATLSLAGAYASFAVTLLMRPLGAALFGSYADRNGRKRAMTVSVFGVGIATALLGTLPTIAQVGVIAPVLFVVLRLIQGVFVGGVVASTHTIGTETVGARWRGLMSGLIGGGGASIGALLASLAFYVVSSLFPGPAFATWGWRIMFFTGIVGAIFSFFIFEAVEESPLWVQLHAQKDRVQRAPLRVVFSRPYLGVVLVNLMVVAGAGTQYYLTSGYLPSFLVVVNKLPRPVAGQVLIWASLIVIVAVVLFGHLSEILGRRRTFILMGALNLVLIPWSYLRLAHLHGDSFGAIVGYSLLLAFLGNMAYAPVLVFLNERFPTAIRASGTALSWNIGFAIGGIVPTFVTVASRTVQGIPGSLVTFLTAAIVLYLVGALLSPETRGQFQ